MSKRIAIIVEGATEMAFEPHLRAFLAPRLAGKMPKLKFLAEDGRIPKEQKLKREVELLLRTYDAVIALTDVYCGTHPAGFVDAADAKEKMRRWVGQEPRFHPHAAQHDFEAWLLPYWPAIRKLADSKASCPSPAPETVNHDKPPSRHLMEVFRTGAAKRKYIKSRDANRICQDRIWRYLPPHARS